MSIFCYWEKPTSRILECVDSLSSVEEAWLDAGLTSHGWLCFVISLLLLLHVLYLLQFPVPLYLSYFYTYIHIYIYIYTCPWYFWTADLILCFLKKMKKRLSIAHCYIADSSTEEKPINGLRIRCHRKLIDRDNVQRVQLFLNWIWRHLLDLLIHFQSCLFYERIRYEGGSGTRHNSCRSIPGCWKTLLGRRN